MSEFYTVWSGSSWREFPTAPVSSLEPVVPVDVRDLPGEPRRIVGISPRFMAIIQAAMTDRDQSVSQVSVRTGKSQSQVRVALRQLAEEGVLVETINRPARGGVAYPTYRCRRARTEAA